MVLKTQHRHPLGLYPVLPILARHPPAFHAVVQAAESFDYIMLKRLNNVPDEFKQMIVQLSTQPQTLCQLVRHYLRRYLQPKLPLKVSQLEVPTTLRAYLLFETS